MGASGASYIGTDSNGVLGMQSNGGFSMANSAGDTVGMQVISEGLPPFTSASTSLLINSPVTSTGLRINSGLGDEARLMVGTDGRLSLDKGLSIGEDVSVQGQLFSGAGSFQSSEPTSGVGSYVGVVDGLYTGSDTTDRPAVQGTNAINSGWGIGGSFTGGYKGLEANSHGSGSFSRYGVRASASGGDQRPARSIVRFALRTRVRGVRGARSSAA